MGWVVQGRQQLQWRLQLLLAAAAQALLVLLAVLAVLLLLLLLPAAATQPLWAWRARRRPSLAPRCCCQKPGGTSLTWPPSTPLPWPCPMASCLPPPACAQSSSARC